MGWLPVVLDGCSTVEGGGLDDDPHDWVVASLEAVRLRRLVAALPEPERGVLCWRYGLGVQHLTRREIAMQFGMSVRAVREAERRALDRLRAAYGLREAA